ncbi:alpha/beta hydrolase [Burkholderia gladioli]|uniref:alpha/beta hydrolase n=1 Tax=Burkholderia gladioli TaxID=28095 RepID=UPI0016408F91|nr:alpha/beta hydrolase [Burkholderia gladioli]
MKSVYRGMTRAQLDVAYDNPGAVDDFPAVYAAMRARSAALYARLAGQGASERDLHYGPAPRQRYDYLACGHQGAPLFVFIHGGYWQKCDKEDFAYVAAGPLAHGFDVVLAEYTLAPEAGMARIVGEIGALLDHLAAEPATRERALCLSGHSAGGHLTAVHRAHPSVQHAMPISALVELEPIRLGRLNERLQLSEAEVDSYSPLRRIGAGAPLTVAVGAAELPELVRHSREYAEACRAAGQPVAYLPVAGATHFSVLDDLAEPGGAQMTALMARFDRV